MKAEAVEKDVEGFGELTLKNGVIANLLEWSERRKQETDGDPWFQTFSSKREHHNDDDRVHFESGVRQYQSCGSGTS